MYEAGYGGYGSGCQPMEDCSRGGGYGYAFILVLFILLVIIGCTCIK